MCALAEAGEGSIKLTAMELVQARWCGVAVGDGGGNARRVMMMMMMMMDSWSTSTNREFANDMRMVAKTAPNISACTADEAARCTRDTRRMTEWH